MLDTGEAGVLFCLHKALRLWSMSGNSIYRKQTALSEKIVVHLGCSDLETHEQQRSGV